MTASQRKQQSRPEPIPKGPVNYRILEDQAT